MFSFKHNFVLMGRIESKYIQDKFTALDRKFNLDRDIYNWICCQKFTIPSISVNESCLSFLRYHGIDEGELTLSKMHSTYNRIQKELFEEQKTKS